MKMKPQQEIQRWSVLTAVQACLFLLLLILLLFFQGTGNVVSAGLALVILIVWHFYLERLFRQKEILTHGKQILLVGFYLVLCTVLVWLTRGEEESPLWIVYFLPIIITATHFSFKVTLTVSSAALLLFVSHLPLSLYRKDHFKTEFLPEMLGFGIMFFLVGTLVQNFTQRNRQQLSQTRELNNQLLKKQQELKMSLEQLESAEKSLRAKERLASLGELSAGIAHEIRNPLGIISSSAQMLEHKYPLRQDRELLDIIQEESSRLNSLITDFLFFGRQLEPQRQDCELAPLIRRQLDSLKEMAGRQGVELVFANHCTNDVAFIDAAMIQQVLLNLFLNALEATPPGGRVDVSLVHKQAHFEIVITDTGCGIAPEHRDKIFDPFFTTKGSGTGLGLANSYKIVQSHGGDISCETTVGAGTAMTLILPSGVS